MTERDWRTDLVVVVGVIATAWLLAGFVFAITYRTHAPTSSFVGRSGFPFPPRTDLYYRMGALRASGFVVPLAVLLLFAPPSRATRLFAAVVMVAAVASIGAHITLWIVEYRQHTVAFSPTGPGYGLTHLAELIESGAVLWWANGALRKAVAAELA